MTRSVEDIRQPQVPRGTVINHCLVIRSVSRPPLCPTLRMDLKLKLILGFLGTVLVLGLGTGLVVKVLALGSSSSSDIYNIKPGSDVHCSDTEVFDFSNTKITGSAILGILTLILALSYIFKKHIRIMTATLCTCTCCLQCLGWCPTASPVCSPPGPAHSCHHPAPLLPVAPLELHSLC